jgi:hypothetical protein
MIIEGKFLIDFHEGNWGLMPLDESIRLTAYK